VTDKIKKKHEQAPEDSAKSRELLLTAATRLFADKGYEGTTVKDLADAAGVNVSLVSYYFQGKEGLYRACLETFGTLNVNSAERILKNPSSREEFRLRLQMFAEEFIQINFSQPDVCRIINRDFEFAADETSEVTKLVQDIFKKNYLPMYQKLVAFIKSSQKAKIVRSELDVDVTVTLIFGSLVQMVRMEMHRKAILGQTLLDAKNRDKTLEHYVDVFVNGVCGE
jgi:AcrR family transcriptional regulator